VLAADVDQLRDDAAKVCNYLGSAYDGEPRRVIEALVQRAYGVTEAGQQTFSRQALMEAGEREK
jgi:hypothetical protein